MRRTQRRLFNLFAFALLAFAIYLIMFHKDDEALQNSQPATGGITAGQQTTAQHTH